MPSPEAPVVGLNQPAVATFGLKSRQPVTCFSPWSALVVKLAGFESLIHPKYERIFRSGEVLTLNQRVRRFESFYTPQTQPHDLQQETRTAE